MNEQIGNKINDKTYIKLTPFKGWVLENFPFIEADFDAITNYQLLCKVIEYLNNVISNQNTVQELGTDLVNAYNSLVDAVNLAIGEFEDSITTDFNTLHDYVYNYFNNLDVQEEINNKLDDMVEQGTLQEIIADYLNSKAIFGFDNVASMKSSTNLIDGSYAKTLGYHNINDGGSALYKIREVTNEDVVDNMLIIAMNNNQLVAELIVINSTLNVKQLGAYGDDSHDDTLIIQKAIDSLIGGIVLLPTGTYLISSPLILKRGVSLKGINNYDTNTDGSAQIKLADNSNCSMIKTPLANSGTTTQYISIENLYLNGNKDNQTEEVNIVEFYGVYIGSYIKNVFIGNFYGTGIDIQQCDLLIDNLWIQNGYTTSGKYAFDTNSRISDDSIIGNMLNINHLYVENYANENTTVQIIRSDASKRANGIKFKQCATININELHIEGVKNGITLDKSWNININNFSGIFTGYANNDSAFVYLNSAPRSLTLKEMISTGSNQTDYWVKKISTFSSNTIPNIPYSGSYPTLTNYTVTINDNYLPQIQQHTRFNNWIGITKVGTADTQNLYFYPYVDDTTKMNYIKSKTLNTFIGSNVNQTGNKNFITISSYGNNADSVAVSDPLKLGERTTYNQATSRSIYDLNIGPFGHGPVFQAESNTESGVRPIATVRIGTSAPTEQANYRGELYLDYNHKILYVATAFNSATPSDDWTALN